MNVGNNLSHFYIISNLILLILNNHKFRFTSPFL
jgi:hypothetical protein